MNHYTIEDKAQRYTRISKHHARMLYNSGKPFRVALCPVKLRPGYPFASHMTLTEQRFDCWDKLIPFNDIARDFEWYNCNMWEAGYYAAFYLVEDK